MFINFKGIHLVTSIQKRPELWQSAIPPYLQTLELSKVQFKLSNQKLEQMVKVATQHSELKIAFQLKSSKLTDSVKALHTLDDLVSINFGLNHQNLIDLSITKNTSDDTIFTSVGVGNHKLYAWGVSGEVLFDDNSQLNFRLDKQKLYEEV